MQLTDKDGNVFGTGGLEITTSTGKPKIPVINTDITIGTTAIVGGVAGRLLYDDAGVVGETGGINWNPTTSTLSLLDSPFYSQAGNSSANTGFSITGTASSNYTIYSSRQFIFNTGQSMYFNTDTDGGSALDRAWYFAGARSGLTGGRTYGALTVDSSGFPSFTLYNNDNGARILLASNATSYFNGGNLLVGTTTDTGHKLYVNGTARVSEIEVNNGVANTRARLTDSSLQFSRLSDGGYTPSISRLQSSGGLLFEGYDGGHKFVRGATVLAYINVTNPNYSGSGYLGVTNISTTSIQTAGNDTLYLTSDAASGSNDGIVFDRGTRSVTAVHSITTWKAAGVEKGRFTQGGSLLINTTTDAGYKLDVAGTGRFSNTLTIQTTATGGSPSNSILISTNDTGNGGRISWGDSNTSILRYSNSLYFREYTGNFVFESTGANAIYFSIRPGGTTLSAGPFTTNSSITAASAIARGAYFNNTLTQSVANDVLTAVQITPTLSVNNTLFHEVYWLRLTGSYTPASFTGNNNATTIDLSNSFTNTNNAIGIRIRHTYSNVQNGYGLLIESGGFIGIAQTSTTSRNFFAGTTVIGSSVVAPAAGYTLHVTNNTNGAIKIGTPDISSEHLIISHSQAGATFSSIRSTFVNTSAQMQISVAGQDNLRLWGTGNVIVGGTTDAGFRLDVAGTGRFQGGIIVSNPSFTGQGSIAQAGNNTTVITGRVAGASENITFGPSNRIFINAGQSRFPSGSVQIGWTLTVGNSGFASSTNMLYVTGGITASSAIARGGFIDTALTASANNDVLVGLDIAPTFTNGAFTGISNIGFRLTQSGSTNNIFRMSSSSGSANIIQFFNLNGETFQGGIVATNTVFNYGTYATNQVNISGGTGGVAIRTNNSAPIRFYATNVDGDFSTVQMQMFGATGNLLLQNGGTYTDAGYKLDVNGTARVVGSFIASAAIGAGSGSFALGTLATAASSTHGGALGYDAQSLNAHALAFGYSSRANGHSSVAIGRLAIANAADSVAFHNATSAGINSAAFGNGSTTTGTSSMATGSNAYTYLTGQLAVSGGSLNYKGDSQYSIYTGNLNTGIVNSGGTYSFAGIRPSNSTFGSDVTQIWYVECVVVFAVKGRTTAITEFALRDTYSIKYKLAVKSTNSLGTTILGTPVADSSFSDASMATTFVTFTIVSNNLVVNVTPPTWTSGGQMQFRGTASFGITELGVYGQPF